jgi:hypothetical protein
MAMHGVFRLKGRKIAGRSDEWVRTTRAELLTIVRGMDELQSPWKNTT